MGTFNSISPVAMKLFSFFVFSAVSGLSEIERNGIRTRRDDNLLPFPCPNILPTTLDECDQQRQAWKICGEKMDKPTKTACKQLKKADKKAKKDAAKAAKEEKKKQKRAS